MKAGIDFGTTLTKATWKQGQQYKSISTADYSLADFIKILKNHKIKKINVAGIVDIPKQFEYFQINKPKQAAIAASLIKTEIETQVKGLKKLFTLKNQKIPSDYLLVSIGTGTSYTRVQSKKIRKIPLGNSLAGGTLMGLANVLKIKDFDHLADMAKKGNYKNVDLYFGDLIVSNLGNIKKSAYRNDIAAGLMNIIAITTYKDLAIYDSSKYGKYKNIIYIGSTLRGNACLKKLLKKYTEDLNKKPIFISGGEYSTSLGALESHYN